MNHVFSRIQISLTDAARQLRRSPGFSLLALVVLSLGVGAAAVVWALFQSIILQPLPYPEPARLVGLQAMNAPKALAQTTVSVADFRDFAGRTKTLSAMVAFRPDFAAFTAPNEPPVRLVTALVTEQFHATFGVQPVVGRGFSADAFSYAGERTVILSAACWRRVFGGDPAVLGRAIILNDQPHTVIGVMPDDFREPAFVDAWLPFPAEAPEYFARDSRFWTAIGRLAAHATVDQARTEVQTIAADLMAAYPATNRDWSVGVEGLAELRTSGLRVALVLLAGAVALVLIIAACNLANLLLARGVARLPEMGVRLALGVTPGALARQVMIESALLATGGGLVGIVGAWLVLPVLVARLPVSLFPRSFEIALHPATMGVALLAAIAAGLIFGGLPAWQLRRLDVNTLLKSGGARGGTDEGGGRVQRGLVVGQIALAVVVVAGAVLLLRSLTALQAVPLGLNPQGVVTVRLAPPAGRFETNAEMARYYDDLVAAAAAVPGVGGAAVNASAPFGGVTLTYPVWPDGVARDASTARDGVYAPVTAGYFDTLGLRLRAGRFLTLADNEQGRPVAVLNETMARRLFPNGDALGRQVMLLPWMGEVMREVVGIVADARQEDLSALPPGQVYVPQSQMPWFFSTLVVRLDRPGVGPALREALQRADPTLPVALEGLPERIQATTTRARLYTALFSGFALAALGLAGFGIYANLRFLLGRRTREVGIRLALGATPATILRWMLGYAARLAALGLVIGLAVVVAAGRTLQAHLPGVSPWSAGVLLGVGGLIALLTLLAAWPSARRAARLSPSLALQAD